LDKKNGEKVLGSFEVQVVGRNDKKQPKVLVISKTRVFIFRPDFTVNKKRIHHGLYIRGFTYCEGVNECIIHMRAKPDYHIISVQYLDIKQCL
jgi:hypothetical protein